MTKREKEKQVVKEMITLYCHANHKTKKSKLCPDCARLLEYAQSRSDCCPFMETKSFCVNCKVHCYRPEMREQIRRVMRYSGPRMIFHHPLMTIHHVISVQQEKKKLEK